METWHPFLANATSYGFFMLAAYIAAAVLCFTAARKCADHPHYRQDGARIRTMRRERLLWTAMGAFLAILAAYRQFDLTDLIAGLGRSIAAHDNWYDQRRPLQATVLSIIVIAIVTSAAIIARTVSAVNPLALIALAACTVLVLLLGTNALSLHWTDTLLHAGYHRVNVYNMLEAGSLAVIVATSLLYRREAMVALLR